jgi:hypothetical protein
VARFLISSSGGCLALSVGPSPCCAVEEICHGSAGWVGDVRGVFVAESAKHFHPHGHSVIFDDPQEEPVLLSMRQVCHPGGELAGIVCDLVEWWTCLGCDCEQVVVEAEELGQCLLRRGKRG